MKFYRHPVLLVIQGLIIIALIIDDHVPCAVAVDVDVDVAVSHSTDSSLQNSTIYTYFERIPFELRTTGMEDADDDRLLEYWKQTWSEAGWTPVVLGLIDAQKLPTFEIFEHQLLRKELQLDPFSKALFHRWMAMAAIGGGWYADYDVFPIGNVSEFVPPVRLPNEGRMTVHDILSPTLASGTGKAWQSTLSALLEDAKNHTTHVASRFTFWTDSLGINNLVKDYRYPRENSMIPLTGTKRVLLPYGRNDPVASGKLEDCSARNIRSRWVLHISPRVFQMSNQVESDERHPQNRQLVAQKWLRGWNSVCQRNSTMHAPTTTM